MVGHAPRLEVNKMRELNDNQMQRLTNRIKKVGKTGTPEFKKTRVDHFTEGKAPFLVDIHEAVLDNHISKEEGEALNSNYRPDKQIGTYSGNRPRYQRHTLSRQVQERSKQIGMYKPKENKGK